MIQIVMNPRVVFIFLLAQIVTIILRGMDVIDNWFLAALPSTLVGLIALISYVGIMTAKTKKSNRGD